jgi:hypothetical protein
LQEDTYYIVRLLAANINIACFSFVPGDYTTAGLAKSTVISLIIIMLTTQGLPLSAPPLLLYGAKVICSSVRK